MDRYQKTADIASDSPPSEAWLFAQVILGKPIPRIVSPEARARTKRQELERLAPFSSRHAEELRKLRNAEAEARRERESLEWAAQISTRAEDKLRALRRKEAEEREAWRRSEQFYENYLASMTEWDEVDHPRQPQGTPEGGQWVVSLLIQVILLRRAAQQAASIRRLQIRKRSMSAISIRTMI